MPIDRFAELKANAAKSGNSSRMGTMRSNDRQQRSENRKSRMIERQSMIGSRSGYSSQYGDVEMGQRDPDEMTKFLNDIKWIDGQIKVIKENIEDISQFHQQALNSLDHEEAQQINADIEDIVIETNEVSNLIRNKIKSMDAAIKKLANGTQNGNAELRMRTTRHQQITKKFIDLMTEYQNVQMRYKKKYQEKQERQYKLVRPNATREELRALESNGGDSRYLQQQLAQVSGSRAEQQRALEEMQERHREIAMIESSIVELHQLFLDMSMMVEQQGDFVNQIEHNVGQAANYTEQAVVELQQAVVHQKSARKKKWMIFWCCVVLFIILALLLWFYVFNCGSQLNVLANTSFCKGKTATTTTQSTTTGTTSTASTK